MRRLSQAREAGFLDYFNLVSDLTAFLLVIPAAHSPLACLSLRQIEISPFP